MTLIRESVEISGITATYSPPSGMDSQRVGTTEEQIVPQFQARRIIETTIAEGPAQTSDLLLQQFSAMARRLHEPLTDDERERMANIFDAEIGMLKRNIGDYRRLFHAAENIIDGDKVPLLRKADRSFVVDLNKTH